MGILANDALSSAMGPVHAASRVTALAAGILGSLLTWLFHQPSGAIAMFIGAAFGAVSALVAYALVYRVAPRRLENKKPVLGAIRGAALGIATFLIAVIVHTAFFPGRGGFFVSLVPNPTHWSCNVRLGRGNCWRVPGVIL